jgi:hypothetical protein
VTGLARLVTRPRALPVQRGPHPIFWLQLGALAAFVAHFARAPTHTRMRALACAPELTLALAHARDVRGKPGPGAGGGVRILTSPRKLGAIFGSARRAVEGHVEIIAPARNAPSRVRNGWLGDGRSAISA